MVLSIFAYQFYGIYQRLDWRTFVAALGRPEQWKWLAVALLLMPVNWLLEARKWQLLLGQFTEWPLGKTLRATLAGVSISAVTPNRIGEIGGRLLYARLEEAPAVLTSSLLGSACQWIAFLLLGAPALIWTAELSPWLLPLGPLLLLVAGIGGKPLLLKLLGHFDGALGLDTKKVSQALAGVKLPLILRAGWYACLRFVVYCTQLYLLLRFFGLVLPWLKGTAGIAAIYLVQAGIPLPPGVNLLARTELGFLLWQTDATSGMAVLAAFTTLFAVNVLLPALPGYWLLVRKNKNYESPVTEN